MWEKLCDVILIGRQTCGRMGQKDIALLQPVILKLERYSLRFLWLVVISIKRLVYQTPNSKMFDEISWNLADHNAKKNAFTNV